MGSQIKIDYVDKLYPIFTKPKRIKIIVGGRGSTKSTGVADLIAARLTTGELWCCAREHQNSIEESVHRTILDEIGRLDISGFIDTKTSIEHQPSGGRVFYRGLARNITSLKSTLSGVDGLWIEEGEDLSDNTLRVLTASVRLNATDTQRKMAGEDVRMPEIIITMNRGRRDGAVAKKWLARAEEDLRRCGYYEDDLIMVVQVNYTDMPADWFLMSGLEEERLDDKSKLSHAAYRHKWHGDYLDEVEDSIIRHEWFEACIDAHKLPRLAEALKPRGARIAGHDPSDGGRDAAGYALRHGSIITRVADLRGKEIDVSFDWATRLAREDGADWFIWDGDGMGAGLKRQAQDAFGGTRTQYQMFRGSLSGEGQDNGDKVYQPTDGSTKYDQLTYADVFRNNRAQYYTELADRMYNTYRAVVKGEYIDPEIMISFDSDGIESIEELRSELCSIPTRPDRSGMIQLMAKQEIKSKLGVASPNMGDAVMMTMFRPPTKKDRKPLKYSTKGIV